MTEQQPLWKDIVSFSKDKYKIATILIILGVLGLILPIIPGIILLGAGILIFRPDWYEKVKKWIKFN